jgi:hypothetical protein
VQVPPKTPESKPMPKGKCDTPVKKGAKLPRLIAENALETQGKMKGATAFLDEVHLACKGTVAQLKSAQKNRNWKAVAAATATFELVQSFVDAAMSLDLEKKRPKKKNPREGSQSLMR